MNKKLESLITEYGIKRRAALNRPEIEQKLKTLGITDPQFVTFYEEINGLSYEWFEIFPLCDERHIKQTWNSLERANDKNVSNYLNEYADEVRDQFVVFASIGGRDCAALSKHDSSIWYEENEELHQTDLSLLEFIETVCREVMDF